MRDPANEFKEGFICSICVAVGIACLAVTIYLTN